MNVYQKLNLAREIFHQSELKKSGHNKFAGYNYFELGDFVVPALKIFKEVGLTSVISFGNETATMTIINNDKAEETIVIASPMSEANLKGCHPVQNLGAVQTYIRRYLWVAALEIVEHDALDSSPGVATPKISPTKGDVQIPDDRLSIIFDVVEAIKERMEADDVLGAYEEASGITDPEEKTKLWSLLDSKTRSAIKKISSELKGQ